MTHPANDVGIYSAPLVSNGETIAKPTCHAQQEIDLSQSLMAQPALVADMVRMISEPGLWGSLLMIDAFPGACRSFLPYGQAIFKIGLITLVASAVSPMPLAFGLGLVGGVATVGIGWIFRRVAITRYCHKDKDNPGQADADCIRGRSIAGKTRLLLLTNAKNV